MLPIPCDFCFYFLGLPGQRFGMLVFLWSRLSDGFVGLCVGLF